MRTVAALAFGLMLSALAGPSQAQDYPSRSIRMLVGFPAGGGVDVAARIIGQELAKGLGQSVVIENKVGVASILAANEVARSTPDGYTLLVVPGGHAALSAVFKSVPFDIVESFEWISNIVTIPFFLVVPAASEFRTLADLVAKAKAAPGTVTFGTPGPGTTLHIGVELLASRAGVKFLHVPYRGDALVNTALLAAEVQFGLATPAQAIGNVTGGRLRALAVSSNTRHPGLPDVPTVEQAIGVQNYDVRSWFALAGPAGIPKPVVARLNAEVQKALAVPEVRARYVAVGAEPNPGTPQEMRDRVARELAIWTKTVDDAGIPKQ